MAATPAIDPSVESISFRVIAVLLLQMLPHFNRRTKAGSTLYAAFCLAFAAFLRVGESTYTARDLEDPEFAECFLTRRSVSLFEDHLELTLPASKDPFRRGITLTIAASGDVACPVQALRYLFRWEASADSPLFQWDKANGHVSTPRVTHLEGHYSGHSFRGGRYICTRGRSH